MRKIEIEPELRVRFSERAEEFDDGFEVGLVAARMAAGEPSISREVTPAIVPQLDALARRLSYRVEVLERRGDGASVVIRAERTAQRPRLRVVSR